jgi:hypothetical protein
MTDTRIVYGMCTWWDSIDKVGKSPHGLPICPYCRSPLMEVANEEEWWKQVNSHAIKYKGYREFIEWLRGKCFPNFLVAEDAYRNRPET